MGEPKTKVSMSARNLWTFFAANTVIVGAGLYLCGWVYLHFYLAAFGVDIGIFKFDWNDVLIRSGNVLLNCFKFIFLDFRRCLLFLVLIPLLVFTISHIKRYWKFKYTTFGDFNAKYYLPTIVTLVATTVLIAVAQWSAYQDALSARVADPDAVALVANSNCREASAQLSSLPKGKEWYLLLAAADWVILYAKTGDEDTDSSGNPTISAVRVIQVRLSCIDSLVSIIRPPKSPLRVMFWNG